MIANEEFRPYGFNVQGARVLIALLDAGPTRVGELSHALAIDLWRCASESRAIDPAAQSTE
jgi:hypothetical protein